MDLTSTSATTETASAAAAAISSVNLVEFRTKKISSLKSLFQSLVFLDYLTFRVGPSGLRIYEKDRSCTRVVNVDFRRDEFDTFLVNKDVVFALETKALVDIFSACTTKDTDVTFSYKNNAVSLAFRGIVNRVYRLQRFEPTDECALDPPCGGYRIGIQMMVLLDSLRFLKTKSNAPVTLNFHETLSLSNETCTVNNIKHIVDSQSTPTPAIKLQFNLDSIYDDILKHTCKSVDMVSCRLKSDILRLYWNFGLGVITVACSTYQTPEATQKFVHRLMYTDPREGNKEYYFTSLSALHKKAAELGVKPEVLSFTVDDTA